MTTKEISDKIRDILWCHAPEFFDEDVDRMSDHIARYIEQLVERERRVDKPSDF